MEWYHIAGIFLGSFIIFIIIHKIGKQKRPVRRAFLSFLSGFLTLLAVEFTSGFTGVFLPFSLLTVMVSAIGGIPGVTALLTLNLFF